MHWEKKDGNFPKDEVHGNFIPSEVKLMCRNFVDKNHSLIDTTVDKLMQKLMNTNADALTAGRQTFCPFTTQSVTAATAFKRALDFLSENHGASSMSCLEWIQMIMRTFEKEVISYPTTVEVEEEKVVFDEATKQKVRMKSTKRVRRTKKTSSVKETRSVMMDLTRRYASYIKHKERGKKDRRAICSAGMFMRMFLKIMEDSHLEISKTLGGSTISIGGEEKKLKIANILTSRDLEGGTAGSVTQGTEDATKWNECLSPAVFALMHLYLFDDQVRFDCGKKPASQWG